MSPAGALPEPRWGDAAALVLLCGGGLAAWWGPLGSGLLWLTPLIVVAALVAAGLLGRAPAIVLAVAWMPVAILLAGLPAGNLAPDAIGTTAASLREAVQALPTIDSAAPVVRAWALAAGLLVGGIAAILAAILWRTRRRDLASVGLALLVLPLAGAIAIGHTPNAPWPGALVVAAVLLHTARGRLLPIALGTALVGAVALFGAQAMAPRAGWQLLGHHAQAPAFRQLDSRQTYGPLEDRRTGAVMFDVTASRPALWRMQVLEKFDSLRWDVGAENTFLPEPEARMHSVEVEVRGLRNRLVVSPGQIEQVSGAGRTSSVHGDARQLVRTPAEGQTYRVVASTVEPTEARLASIPVPTGHRYLSAIEYGLGPLPIRVPVPVAELAENVPAPLRGTDWARTFRLSARLSAGVESELGVVRRVESYLLRGGRFHYTTEVGVPSSDPLFEFLFHTHRGYCQHFAGAAALLLRVAGVPTRVAVGFATGEQIGDHTWAVRDEDAHAWIEVYFPQVGWVPFNPTPPSAEADVAPGLDLLQAAAAPGPGAGGPGAELVGAVAIAVLLLLVASQRRRARRGPQAQLADLLARVSPQPPEPRTTLRNLHLTLTEVGPAVADLALVAERARFAPCRAAEPSRPRLAVWRALVSDLGFTRALGLMARVAVPAGRH